MSKHSPIPAIDICTKSCRLKEHGRCINAAITKLGITDYQVACYINSICRNCTQTFDDEGRNALLMAASCGRRDLCRWLIKAGSIGFNVKDTESAYTPLHRCIFYGHINNAVLLIEMGTQMNLMDKDDLLATDHAMKDRLIKEFSVNNPCQVYVWGNNFNYTLGTDKPQRREEPELLDFFRKNNTSIRQVATDKFHSVFVSTSGRVWACGHGRGGRLGIDSEHTVLTPQPVKTGPETVVFASVGTNHTILLMESGAVWTCGSNNHHVLGHSPPPNSLLIPRPIHPRLLKPAGGPIIGVAAARYHSVLWSDSVVLTFGLNGGQLGHPQTKEKTVIEPKQVSGVSPKYKIGDVAASVGATVVSIYETAKRDILLLHNYQVRRIASKILDVTKISVFGGELNAELDGELTAKGGDELRVMVLTSTGKVLLWTESFPQFTRCIHPLKRSLTFIGLSLCLSGTLLITNDGEAYLAHVKPRSKKKVTASSPKPENTNCPKTENMSFSQFLEKVDYHHMSINRVPNIYRAVGVATDPKGKNFMVIQENPIVHLTDIPLIEDSEFHQQMGSLLKDAHEDDTLHDVMFEVDNGSVPAHHFVLALSSEEFATMARTAPVTTVKLKGVNVQVLNQVLTFAYTHDCDIIHPGPFHSHLFEGDIIKAAFDLAKRFKMPVLMKCLQLLRFEDGVILMKDNNSYNMKQVLGERRSWKRTMFPELHDTSIATGDGATFKVHKCVLAARLEYFNNMFTGGWVEAAATTNLSLPIPQTSVREVIDFLYEDEAPSLIESQDVDYISSVLVVADRLFIKRLKQICEVALAGKLSLRNAALLLQLAITYNSDQLKNCCMQFICLNLATVLESRILKILDNKTLEELSEYYRDMIPPVGKRIITPFTTHISEEEMIEIANAFPVTWLDAEELANDIDLITTPKLNRSNPIPISTKKKTQRHRKSSESQRKRVESVSSNSDLDCSIDATPTEKIDFDDLVERNNKNKTEEWVTVDKIQKTVQSRLKVITAASTVQPTPENFTPLVPSFNPPSCQVGSPPLPQDNKHFPQLSPMAKFSTSPKSINIDIKRSPVVKLSQKQRKKLAQEEVRPESEPVPVPVRTPWATINNNVECSLADIMRTALTVGSPPHSEQDRSHVRFTDIVAEEIQQRDNWSKMKSKSLQLTQMEDKAMEELSTFYNAANMFDERITVERVLSANIAKPIWITSHHQ